MFGGVNWSSELLTNYALRSELQLPCVWRLSSMLSGCDADPVFGNGLVSGQLDCVLGTVSSIRLP